MEEKFQAACEAGDIPGAVLLAKDVSGKSRLKAEPISTNTQAANLYKVNSNTLVPSVHDL